MAPKSKPARIGRPPRRDAPTRITILLPGTLRAWLRLQAAREMRDQGDIVTDGLRLYRRGDPVARVGRKRGDPVARVERKRDDPIYRVGGKQVTEHEFFGFEPRRARRAGSKQVTEAVRLAESEIAWMQRIENAQVMATYCRVETTPKTDAAIKGIEEILERWGKVRKFIQEKQKGGPR